MSDNKQPRGLKGLANKGYKMKLSLVSLISILMILTGCEQQQFEYEFGSAEKAATNSSSDAEGNDREEVKFNYKRQ